MARSHSSPVKPIGPILVVNDYDDARATVREALEDAGYAVVEAANGQQALDLLVSRPDESVALVVLDLQMPIMDGWQLLDLMSNYVGLASIPVIIVTAHQARLEQLRHPGIFAYIQAPCGIDELVNAVDARLAAPDYPHHLSSKAEGIRGGSSSTKMSSSGELKVESFFASRAGVCVYVPVGARTFRIEFATPDSLGITADGGHDGAEEACRVARRALSRHFEQLTPLFEKVDQART
jgi:CheY-like chemotaxis protein